MKTISVFAGSTIALGFVSLLCLLLLHVVSRVFKPNFRMISEYALGKHKWLLTAFFICWGLSTLCAGMMLWDVVSTGWSTFGVILLLVSGIGAIMGVFA